jgi:hypothetical protein
VAPDLLGVRPAQSDPDGPQGRLRGRAAEDQEGRLIRQAASRGASRAKRRFTTSNKMAELVIQRFKTELHGNPAVLADNKGH